MKKLMTYKGYPVNVMVIEPNGIYAMLRRSDEAGRMPFVANVKDLVNVTKHNKAAGLSCMCQECIDRRKRVTDLVKESRS